MQHGLAVRLAAFSAGAFLTGLVFFTHTRPASACGCFTPPDPSVPIVQAGERIAFQIKDGRVAAHIQIQYSGPAEEFGWLLPLPSEPTLEVGTDELFLQLIQQTQPLYRLIPEYRGNCWFDPSRSPSAPGEGDGGDDGGGDGEPGGEDDPLVLRDSVGPYDYAVLRADSKEPMLAWLDENGFFVPAGTDEAVDPYIRPGAFFLALKLLKGNDVGDIQPVIVEYASDLPMIPIVLTGVAADPDMPVMVWVFGEHRAIPRNYFHTEINDAEIDWLNAGSNYIDVINKAVDEADRHHSFITEFAGASAPLTDLLDYPGRFGDLTELRSHADAINYIEYMASHGFTTLPAGTFSPSFTGQVVAVLQGHLTIPPEIAEYLADNFQTPNDYYLGLRYLVDYFRENRPDLFALLDLDFDPVALTDELEEKVVTPSLAAGALFRDNPYLTRLFTTLSPNEMTRDPVFSFNPELPDVANVHEGKLIYECGDEERDQDKTPATVVTEDGWELAMPNGTIQNPWIGVDWPKSLLIQIEREEGPSKTVVDNTAVIASMIDELTPPPRAESKDGGCSTGGGTGSAGGLALGALAALLLARRRRA